MFCSKIRSTITAVSFYGVKSMINAEVSIIPIGTTSTSISEYVAESEKALKKHDSLNCSITGMGTQIEGQNIDEILAAIKDMHDAQALKGAQRIYTIVKIDDRRDKQNSLAQKVASVESKI